MEKSSPTGSLVSNTSQVILTPSRQLSDAEKLRKVILELVDTERTYVKHLNNLLENYLEPLKKETFLSNAEINALFGNIQEIVTFQRQFLQNLEEALELEPDFHKFEYSSQFKNALFSIGSAFLYYVNHFKLYSSFCASHSKAQKVLHPNEGNQALQEFLAARNPKQQHSSTLESYLIKPIQRILKYPLLLQQLRNLTDSTTDEHQHLVEALKGMEKVAEHINEMQRIHEEYGAIFDHLFRQHQKSCKQKNKSFRKKSLGDLTLIENNNTSPCNRIFLVEAPCAMSPPTMPMNAKPRHLFLFSDLLLVAKPRSAGTFKLKESVRVSELWIAPCPDSDTGFLLGWPSPARTYLVTFCTQAARDSWWRELKQALAAQLRLEPPTTNIKVVYRDPLSGTECSKTLGVGPEMSSGDVARLALDESRTGDWAYTLYARDRDNAPCPLIGCERPHSIQLARLRQSLCAEEGFDLTHCNNSRIPSDIVFELKPNIKPSPRKTPLKLFRKSNCRFFGVSLSRLCSNNQLPPVILACLRALFQRGPHTQGIFRRCASARALRELREKIDSQGTVMCEEISNQPALLLAALLKDFLRSLPEPLLAGNPQEWLNVAASGRLENLRRLISALPRENHLLLAHVICVLHNIAKRARYNLMSAANLGVCVGPSLLWESSQNAPLRTLPTLVEMLINNCQTLFGNQVLSLLGDVANDSGAEESDSLHSLGLSLDSVELSKDQKSLSRDSGLTLSEDDRESPSLNYQTPSFHRSDWARQAARMRSLDNTWIEEDEAFCASNENLCSPPIPPRRPPPLRHLPPVHLPPLYRPPPPPPPTYAIAWLLLVTDAESESYV